MWKKRKACTFFVNCGKIEKMAQVVFCKIASKKQNFLEERFYEEGMDSSCCSKYDIISDNAGICRKLATGPDQTGK